MYHPNHCHNPKFCDGSTAFISILRIQVPYIAISALSAPYTKVAFWDREAVVGKFQFFWGEFNIQVPTGAIAHDFKCHLQSNMCEGGVVQRRSVTVKHVKQQWLSNTLSSFDCQAVVTVKLVKQQWLSNTLSSFDCQTYQVVTVNHLQQSWMSWLLMFSRLKLLDYR